MNSSLYLIALAVAVGTLVLLVFLLLVAKDFLVPGQQVTITINNQQTKEVESGRSLLATLAQEGIYLPSACGGKGTCGLCKCQVLEGGGAPLPIEGEFLSRAQLRDHWRLACQVKVKDALVLRVPESVLEVKKWEATVVSNRNVSTFIKELVLQLPEGQTLSFRSGGYIQIYVPPGTASFSQIDVAPAYRPQWEQLGLFDLVMKNSEPTQRAYSMANHPAEGNRIKLNVRIATPPWDKAKGRLKRVNPGVCSSYLFTRQVGDTVSLSGPYGEFFLRPTPAEKVFIGGGAGMAPMRSHIFHLFHTLHTTCRVSFWYGARSLGEVFYQEEFEAIARQYPNFTFHIALSEPKEADHWTGPTGFIHQVLYDAYLKDHPFPEEAEYYLCGPPLMTQAVTGLLDQLGVPPEQVLYDNFGS